VDKMATALFEEKKVSTRSVGGSTERMRLGVCL
jgi:hypothetical protein